VDHVPPSPEPPEVSTAETPASAVKDAPPEVAEEGLSVPIDASIDDAVSGREAGEAVPEPAHASQPSAAERTLGSEGLLRLRARHAEVCARIGAQVADPVRQDALRTLAERLNPDAWVTEPEVRTGLEEFETVLDQVRREVGPSRRRTRRGGRRNRRRPGDVSTSPQPAGGSGAAGVDGALADEPDQTDADEQ
jgi:hypothetical protein